MAGIISGYLGGLGKGVADAGNLMLQDQIARERDEANDLRDRALSQNKQDFTASENQKDRDSQEDIATTKSNKAGKDNRTNNIKNMEYLQTEAGGKKSIEESIMLSFPGSKIKHTDEEGNLMVSIPIGNNKFKQIGGYVKDEKGKSVWLNTGEELPNAEVTKQHRDKASDIAKNKDKFWEGDKTSFPSTNGDIKLFRRQEAQRIANKERADKKGIVNGQMKTKSENQLPGGESDPEDTRMIKGRKVSKEEFIRRMVKRHGKDKLKEIESRWKSIK